MTVKEVFEHLFKHHWCPPETILDEPPPRWSKEVVYSFKKHIEPFFGSIPLNEVLLLDLRAWHKNMAARPTAANRALSVFSKIFQYSIENQWRPQNTNLCELVKKFPEKKRKRFASFVEIKKIGDFLKKELARGPSRLKPVSFIYLLLFTGCRPSTLENARWEDFHSEFLELKGKTGRDVIHLSKEAQNIIYNLPKTGDKILGIRMPRRLWAKIKKEVGCEDLWARDLRRTFATVALSSGASIDSIGEILNHKSVQTTKIYAKLMDKSAATVVETTTTHLKNILG